MNREGTKDAKEEKERDAVFFLRALGVFAVRSNNEKARTIPVLAKLAVLIRAIPLLLEPHLHIPQELLLRCFAIRASLFSPDKGGLGGYTTLQKLNFALKQIY